MPSDITLCVLLCCVRRRRRYAYNLACAHFGLRHTRFNHLMVSSRTSPPEGWPFLEDSDWEYDACKVSATRARWT